MASHIIPKAGDAECRNKGDATAQFHCSTQATGAVVPACVCDRHIKVVAMRRHQAIHREECHWKSHKTTSTAGDVSTYKCFCRFWTRGGAMITVWLLSKEQNLKCYIIPPSHGSIISMIIIR